MVLDLSDESVAVKRALGRRVDPLTGRAYHLEFDPPPAKEPGLADRLKVKCSARQWVDRLRVVAQPLWARSAGTPQCSSGQSPAARGCHLHDAQPTLLTALTLGGGSSVKL